MIAALWSNPNYDEENGQARQTAIADIEAKFESALEILRLGYDPNEEEIDYDNPFFAPVKRAMESSSLQLADPTPEDFSPPDPSQSYDQM